MITSEHRLIHLLALGSFNVISPYILPKRWRDNFAIFSAVILSVISLTLRSDGKVYSLFKLSAYTIAVHIEPLGQAFITMISLLWLVTAIYLRGCIPILHRHIDTKRRTDDRLFLAALNATIASTLLLASAANILTMFISYELLTITTIPLIVFYKQPKSYNSLFKYIFGLTGASIALLLPAFLVIDYYGAGNFIDYKFLTGLSLSKLAILLALIIFGTAKAALVPMHGWLPQAMVAPYPVSALLHAVTVVKSGIFCILKLIVYTFGIEGFHSIVTNYRLFCSLIAYSMLYSSVRAVYLDDLKKILAFSTISQLSLILLAIFCLDDLTVVLPLILAHAGAKLVLFLSAGNIFSMTGGLTIRDLRNRGAGSVLNMLVFTLAALSLMGLPPLPGFISKSFLEQSASLFRPSHHLFNLSTVLTSAYLFRILAPALSATISATARENSIPASMILAPMICFCGLIYIFLDYGNIHYSKALDQLALISLGGIIGLSVSYLRRAS